MLLFVLNSAVTAHAAEHRLAQAMPPAIAVTLPPAEGHFADDQPTCKKVAAQLWKDNKKTLLCLSSVMALTLIVTAVKLTPDSRDISSLPSGQSLSVFSKSQDHINEQLDQRTLMPHSLHGKKAQHLQTRTQLKRNNRARTIKNKTKFR